MTAMSGVIPKDIRRSVVASPTVTIFLAPSSIDKIFCLVMSFQVQAFQRVFLEYIRRLYESALLFLGLLSCLTFGLLLRFDFCSQDTNPSGNQLGSLCKCM